MRTQLTFAIGSNPAIMRPAPKATPATDAVMPNVVSNAMNVGNADPATINTPMSHIKSFNDRGFHFATGRFLHIDRVLLIRSEVGGGLCKCILYAKCTCLATRYPANSCERLRPAIGRFCRTASVRNDGLAADDHGFDVKRV